MTTSRTPDNHQIDVNAVVSYNLKAIRHRRGMTQEQVAAGLAQLTGHRLPQASISAMERGFDRERRRRFDAHELYLLSVVFGVPIVYFLLPPPGAARHLAGTGRPVHDLYAASLGREHQLTDVDDRLAGLSDPDRVTAVAAELNGSTSPAAPTWRDDYRKWRDRRLAEITRTRDGLDDAAQVLGGFFDQIRRIGIRNFVADTERTTAMADPDPRHEILTFDPSASRREPLDPTDPAPDQVSVDLSDWAAERLEAVFETLSRSDLAHAWDGDHLVFHDGDKPKVIEVLDRFRDAPWHEVGEVLDRFYEDDEEGF